MTNQEILDAAHKAHASADFEGKGHMLYPWSADAAISDVQEFCRLFALEIQRLTREECAGLCDRFALRDMHPAECAAAIRAMEN